MVHWLWRRARPGQNFEVVRQWPSGQAEAVTGPVTECSWCSKPATVIIHAQWSLFDFDDEPACDEHQQAAVSMFWNRLVDGQRPMDFWQDSLDSWHSLPPLQ